MVETMEQNNIESNQPPIKEACTWAMFCHIAGLGGFVIPVAGSVIGPLIVWQMKKDLGPFVDQNGKEALNFQITMMICAIVAALLCFLCIGVFLLSAVAIVDIIFLIIAAVKAANGEAYHYPISIKFVK